MKTKILKFFKLFLSPFIFLFIGIKILLLISKGKKYVLKNTANHTFDQRMQQHSMVYRLISNVLFYKNINIEVINFDVVPKTPVLFLSNHKSNIDPLIIYKTIYENKKCPLVTFVAKQELTQKKISYILDLIDVIFINRKNPRQALFALENETVNLLKNNFSVCIFPESTRIPGNELGDFFSGASIPAYKSFVSIVPIAIYNSEGQLWDKNDDKQKFKRPKSNKITIAFGKPIPVQKFINLNAHVCMQNVKKQVNKMYQEIHKNLQKNIKSKNSDHQEIMADLKNALKIKKQK